MQCGGTAPSVNLLSGCVCGNETRAMMKHPSPSDFVIDVTDTHVIVTFNPSGELEV